VSEECPEIEMLAAYVDRNLTEAEQRLLEAHMVVCKVCRQTVILTFRTKAAIPDPQLPDLEPPVDPNGT
jgi:Putative zinc-finger